MRYQNKRPLYRVRDPQEKKSRCRPGKKVHLKEIPAAETAEPTIEEIRAVTQAIQRARYGQKLEREYE